MTRRLAHRGPDGEGFYERSGISLGHRRLSVIDVALGAQPLCNEDGSIWVVFNGEIYNFQELRGRLRQAGHHFKTHSDTEVLVHLYEDQGDELVHSLRGMFALAIWDARQRRLLLARDRLGVKPLVYRHDEDGIRFGSELKALLADPSFPKEVDPRSLEDYLSLQYVPAPRTIFAAARKLPPGHRAVYEKGRLTLERYWSPPFDDEVRMSESEAIERVRSTLTEATKRRLISDVPVGAFLSGGIDSTVVVGLMREGARGRIKTFSIGFEEPSFDERAHARQAAEHLGTDHEDQVVRPDAAHLLPTLAWLYDEPFADSSAIPTYYVARLSRAKVTVALTGDGGDEMFAGYLRYRAVWWGERFDRLPRWLRLALTPDWWSKLPASVEQRSARRRLKRLMMMLREQPEDRYLEWVSIHGRKLREELRSLPLSRSLEGYRTGDWFRAQYDQSPARDFVTRTTWVDLMSYLPGDILTKVDLASMAHGLECRGPFLDQEVVELAGKMPLHWKMRAGTGKWIIKKAFPELLPEPLRRRPKMGFGAPIDRWLREDLRPMVGDLLLSSSFADRGWCDLDTVKRMIDDHWSKRWDHSSRLWSLLMLEWWARTYLDEGASTAREISAARNEGPLGRRGIPAPP